MNQTTKNTFWETLKKISVQSPAWLWLLLGFLLLPWTAWQTVIPLAGWLAPIFLLRFTRTSKSRWTIWLVRLAYLGAIFIGHRGLPFSLLGFIGDILLKGLVWTLPYAIDRALSHKLEGFARSLVFPAAFTALDWLVSLTPLSTSGSLAYSQDGSLLLLQIVSITGMWGITFLITWCASIVNDLWENRFNLRPVRLQAGLFAGLMAAALLYGGLRLYSPSPAALAVRTALITVDSAVVTNATRSIDWATFGRSTEAERAALQPKLSPTVDQMLARTQTALKGGAKIIAWQESSAWVLEEAKPDVLDRASALANQYGAFLQISLEIFTHAQALPVLRDQSILIDPTGQVLWTYDKTHPVPYDEAFVTISGNGKLPFVDTPNGRWSTAICFDTYFPGLIRQAGGNGAILVFAPTNDTPRFAESALSMAGYRAIENGFTLLRPTGSGLSAVIDDRGRILASQNYAAGSDGLMYTDLPLHGVRTIYSQVGDVVPYLCTLGLVFLIAWAVLRPKQLVMVKALDRI